MNIVTLVKNEEFTIGWVFKENTTTEKNLTGYTPLVQIRPSKNSNTLYASYDINSPYLRFEPTNGLVSIELPPEITGSIDWSNGVIDCLVYNDVDGDRSPTYTIVVESGVSRPT